MSFYCNGKGGICDHPKDCQMGCEYIDGTGGEELADPLPVTNGDRIRAMDDESLAWLLFSFRIDAFATSGGMQNALPNSLGKICEWLQQPAERSEE